MSLPFYMSNNGILFCVIFGAMMLTAFIMSLLSKNLYTLHVFVRKFSILDLQFPASALELATYIRGIFLLPKELSSKSLRALKGQLYVDFLFMPFAYGTIFLLCILLSHKMDYLGNYIFTILAWLQIIPLLCDMAENIYLLRKIRPDVTPSKPLIHKIYQLIVKIKWSIAIITVVFCISALCYFWLTGNFSNGSLRYFIIVFIIILVMAALTKATANISKTDLDKYQNIGN
jgi:hypothetical protein